MPTNATSPIASLRALLDAGRVREGSTADAVDGVRPAVVVEPASVDEASTVLAFCSANRLAVVPRGGGTKLTWGGAPERADVMLSTARMDAVLDHAAGDLVVVAQAGCRIEALQATLAQSGQMLALDPPQAGATIGGIVATGASGPRRLRYGTPRDLVIGIKLVLSDGTIAHAGGRVVKNVAGYDLGRLFAGSFGTLGLIAEVTFRLHPIPAYAQRLDVSVETPEAAFAAVRLAVSPPLDPVAVELWWPTASGAGRVEARFEGTEPGVRAQTSRLVSLLGHPASRGIGAPSLRDGAPGPAAPAPPDRVERTLTPPAARESRSPTHRPSCRRRSAPPGTARPLPAVPRPCPDTPRRA
jgi:glycolate oxidase FAD binding subunit